MSEAISKPEVTIGIDKSEVFYRLPANAAGLIHLDVKKFLNEVSRFASVQERELLESDRSKLHPINYNAVVRVTPKAEGDGSKFDFLVYQRPSKGNGEARLSGNHSIGLGGHPDRVDVMYNDNSSINLYKSACAGAKRENSEEVTLSESISSISFQGVIYDPSNDVGRYHLGLFGISFVGPDCTVDTNESQILNPHWMDAQAYANGEYNFENWSKIILEALNESDLHRGVAEATA